MSNFNKKLNFSKNYIQGQQLRAKSNILPRKDTSSWTSLEQLLHFNRVDEDSNSAKTPREFTTCCPKRSWQNINPVFRQLLRSKIAKESCSCHGTTIYLNFFPLSTSSSLPLPRKETFLILHSSIYHYRSFYFVLRSVIPSRSLNQPLILWKNSIALKISSSWIEKWLNGVSYVCSSFNI